MLHMAYGLREEAARRLSWRQWNARLEAAVEVLAATRAPMF